MHDARRYCANRPVEGREWSADYMVYTSESIPICLARLIYLGKTLHFMPIYH